MDDFDRRLEIELAHMLDPVVDTPVPRRRRQSSLRMLAGGLDAQSVEVKIAPDVVPVPAPVGTSS
jgi:hypothetical protein